MKLFSGRRLLDRIYSWRPLSYMLWCSCRVWEPKSDYDHTLWGH